MDDDDCPANPEGSGHCPHMRTMGFCCNEGLDPEAAAEPTRTPEPDTLLGFLDINPDARCLRCGQMFQPGQSLVRGPLGVMHDESRCPEAQTA